MQQRKLTKEFLRKNYCERGLSTWAIESKYGFARSAVYNALKRFNLPRRTLAQSHILYPRTNFSGDKCEQAYLTGFAIGDIRVRNHGGALSETISIACGSTKQAQVDLIQDLFSSYGRVWVGKPNLRGVINIEAFVNMSFAFLLKRNRRYDWCIRSKKHFFAFLAGFTDAEGSFYLTHNAARIVWGNYDVAILTFIRDALRKFGIASPSVLCDSLKGYVGAHGYSRNSNYCHITCARKDVVREVLVNVRPYLRHRAKIIALSKIRDNLIARGTIV